MGQTQNNFWNCEYTLEGKAEALHNNILNGTTVVVSSGSFQWGNGATAWTIEGSLATNKIKRHGPNPRESNQSKRIPHQTLWPVGYIICIKMAH